jgi:hypothetical protein
LLRDMIYLGKDKLQKYGDWNFGRGCDDRGVCDLSGLR